ncbi:hypothetical protein [Ruminococcus sp.]|uniref:hypothetical protein n=1 Tax=Ruminococcus sp. TaxID=41978 RepID=UPI0025D396D3|nr:hypothetical protein [Ruminococcus sp.]MBR1432895.1 hypothetical protein [Ruminococcus sp.]
MNSKKLFDNTYKRLDDLVSKAIKKRDYEKALQAMNGIATIEYNWNQRYVDHKLEKRIDFMTSYFRRKYASVNIADTDDSTILFYDSFGLDIRGLAAIYLKALVKTGKRIIYVAPESSKGKQPLISSILSGDHVMIYIDKNGPTINSLTEIYHIYCRYHPSTAFQYIFPWDMDGIIAFGLFYGTVRYKINLTDHAFWSGISSFDYNIEFRDYGANISLRYRGIPKEKITKLPYYPYRNSTIEFEGLPFDLSGKKLVFSGGELYKTLGEGNTYYRILREILRTDSSVVFLYAGHGDDSELIKVMKEFRGRVFHINERNDFYLIMERAYLYLNTYPMVGGLMMQYAALSGCLPITLRHNDDGSGILINEDELGLTYDTADDLLTDVKRLLSDDNYRNYKKKMLKDSVITEQHFNDEMKKLITLHCTDYPIKNMDLNVKEFLKDYKLRFGYSGAWDILSRRNKLLYPLFPILLVRKCIYRLLKKIRGNP